MKCLLQRAEARGGNEAKGNENEKCEVEGKEQEEEFGEITLHWRGGGGEEEQQTRRALLLLLMKSTNYAKVFLMFAGEDKTKRETKCNGKGGKGKEQSPRHTKHVRALFPQHHSFVSDRSTTSSSSTITFT